MKARLTLLLLSLLSACSSLHKAPGSAPETYRPFTPAQWRCEFETAQRLATLRDGERREATVLARVDESGLRLTAVSAIGLRLFDLHQDAEAALSLSSTLPLPDSFNPGWVLRDFQLTHAPLALLRPQLPTGWSLEQEPDGVRSIQDRGTDLVRIEGPAATGTAGLFRLVNLQHRYTLEIQILEFAATSGAGCTQLNL